MRRSWVLVILCSAAVGASAQDLAAEAWQLESKGEALQARDRLQKAVEAAPNNAAALRAYAEFLDRHRDPAAREVYAKLDAVQAKSGADANARMAVLRRLAVLDLIAGDRDAAVKHVDAYRAAGGAGLTFGAPASAEAAKENYIEIPGPLRSFARMAALAPDLRPDELLTALARNVV